MLHRPILYLSEFFERHREEYYDSLSRVRTHNDLEHWLKFFLVGVSETSKRAVDTLQAIMLLRQTDSQKILELGRRAHPAGKLIELLYSKPIIAVNDAAEYLKITPQSANSLVSELERIGILEEITGLSRNRLFAYDKYITLFSGKNQ